MIKKEYKDNTMTTYVVGNMALHTLPNHILARILFYLRFYTSVGVASVTGVNRDLFSRRLYINNLVYRERIDYLNGLKNGDALAKLIQADWHLTVAMMPHNEITGSICVNECSAYGARTACGICKVCYHLRK